MGAERELEALSEFDRKTFECEQVETFIQDERLAFHMPHIRGIAATNMVIEKLLLDETARD